MALAPTRILIRPPRLRPIPRDSASLWLVVAVIGFGLVPLFARHLLAAGLSPEAIALYRFALGLLLGLPLLPGLLRSPAKRRPALALAACGLAMGLAWSAYLRGLDLVPVAWAGLVYMSYPLFVALLAWLWLRQPLQRRALAAGALVMAGAGALLLGAGGSLGSLGPALLLCLPAPLAFAVMILVLVRRSAGLRPLEKLAASLTGTVLGLLPLALAADPGGLVPAAPSDWLWIAGMALITAALPQALYSTMATRLPETRVATLGALELPTMVLIGWLALGEPLGAPEALAVALVMAAVALAPAPPARKLP